MKFINDLQIGDKVYLQKITKSFGDRIVFSVNIVGGYEEAFVIHSQLPSEEDVGLLSVEDCSHFIDKSCYILGKPRLLFSNVRNCLITPFPLVDLNHFKAMLCYNYNSVRRILNESN